MVLDRRSTFPTDSQSIVAVCLETIRITSGCAIKPRPLLWGACSIAARAGIGSLLVLTGYKVRVNAVEAKAACCKQSGLSVSIGSLVISAIQTAENMADAARNTSSGDGVERQELRGRTAGRCPGAVRRRPLQG